MNQIPSPTGLASFRSAQDLAERFHEAYERLAPSFGYITRRETRAFDPQSANGRLMVAVCQELRAALASQAAPEQPEQPDSFHQDQPPGKAATAQPSDPLGEREEALRVAGASGVLPDLDIAGANKPAVTRGAQRCSMADPGSTVCGLCAGLGYRECRFDAPQPVLCPDCGEDHGDKGGA